VFAGSVPTSDPGGTAAEPGALLVIDHKGNLVTQLTTPDKINGPWGMAINDQDDRAQLFVSNVLDGTITRLEVSFAHHSFSVVGRLDNRECRSHDRHKYYCRDERDRGVYQARRFCSDVLDRLRRRQRVCDRRADPKGLYPISYVDDAEATLTILRLTH
jgi:hypothetical protein